MLHDRSNYVLNRADTFNTELLVGFQVYCGVLHSGILFPRSQIIPEIQADKSYKEFQS